MKTKLIAIFLATTTSFLLGCAGMESKPAQPIVAPVVSKTATVVVQKTVTAPVVTSRKLSVVHQGKYSLKDCEGSAKKTSGYLCWRKVGGDPYQGNAAQALAQSGWPKEVQKALLVNFEKKVGAEINLVRGDVFGWMAFGRLLKGGVAKVRNNTIAAWPEGNEHTADVYSTSFKGVEYKLFRVRDCGNFAGLVFKAAEIAEIVPEETPVPPTRLVEVPAPETGWYRKSRVVMREVIVETPIVVVSDGCYGCGSVAVGFSGYVGGGSSYSSAQSAQIIQTVNYNQAAPVAPVGRILSGGTYPQAPSGGSIGGGTYPQAPRVGTIGGGTYPRQAFSGGTYAPGTFGGGTSAPVTFSGGTSSPGAGIGRITGGGTR